MSTLGVAGAGTMGAGIAQLGALAGYVTLLHDPDAAALERGLEKVRAGIRRGVERGRWSEADAAVAEANLKSAATLADLGAAELVIEAAPERLELKQRLFAELAESCAPDAILATNTSSIPVTAIAAGLERPGRVVGMHFFNPPPLMPLLEVIPGLETEPEVVKVAVEVGGRLGKETIVAQDVPGFLVNRLGRPLYTESLRLLAERVGEVAQLDRIARTGGLFRMGAFELMDLVGIDVSFDVAMSFHERSFWEPRWRPSPLQARMVQSGNVGRKSGRGWYDYSGEEYRPADAEPPAPGDGSGRQVAVLGDGATAAKLRELAVACGFDLRDAPTDGVEATFLCDPTASPAVRGRLALLCETRSLASWEAPEAVGFTLPAPSAPYAEVTALESGDGAAEAAITGVLTDLGLRVERVGDGPGLALGRILAAVVNEAAFVLGEGIGTEPDIDAATSRGLKYPHGSLAFGRLLGFERVRAILAGVWEERREDRYRPAPKLNELAAMERAHA